jgi:predicted NAD/FAD-binding protein
MKIAIIGSGISGLGAAYLLNEAGYDISIFEKNDYIGGHSRTIEVVENNKKIPVDTGFIVFNYRNYPLLTGLFNHLKIPVQKSNMSFGVSINNGEIEYGTQKLSNIFAQKINLIKPSFWRMIFDIIRFNKNATKYIDSNLSMGELLKKMRLGAWFRDYYLIAMGAAIWSTPAEKMLEFPARSFLRFFQNHGLLTVTEQPQWYTVSGGSREYVKIITAKFADKIRLNNGVKKVIRSQNKITIIDDKNNEEIFDKVIFACHSDQALSMLEAPTEDELKIIGSFKYQPNKVVLHCDENFMPKNKNCWSSWVYLNDKNSNKISLSYWMNNLQNLSSEKPIIVTLNPSKMPEASKIYNMHIFEHPVFDEAAIDAQSKIENIQGENNTYFCGAYTRYGFHEDGFMSGVKVAEKIGAKIPWN